MVRTACMEKYVITGGKPLNGRVSISGAKNAAVAIIAGAVLVDGVCRIENIPNISDVNHIIEMLFKMGAGVKMINKNTFEINCSHLHSTCPPQEMARTMRASYYLIGSLLGRYHRAEVSLPGGCDFGVRPIDQHVKGFEALGATVEITTGGIVEAKTAAELTGSTVYLDVVSVGATINIMLAATLAKGTTVIENAAKEPHIVDVANFLNSMGADIMGAGTDAIKIRGGERLLGGTYSIIPDQIEAGTYMVAAAAVGGEVLVENLIPKHMESVTAKLVEMGVEVEEYDDSILVRRSPAKRLRRVNFKTLPYPGFPTDMQPQMAVILSTADGTSTINEGVWENRFRYLDELKRMGAVSQVNGRMAVIEGVDRLMPAAVRACDLRAGAALVIAALMTEGTSEVEDIRYIERGYEDIVQKLAALGADIRRVVAQDGILLDKAN